MFSLTRLLTSPTCLAYEQVVIGGKPGRAPARRCIMGELLDDAVKQAAKLKTLLTVGA